jgi:hypothetical protein
MGGRSRGRDRRARSNSRRRSRRAASPRSTKTAKRDPKAIRARATEQGIAVPARGRIPSEVERQYNEAKVTGYTNNEPANQTRT